VTLDEMIASFSDAAWMLEYQRIANRYVFIVCRDTVGHLWYGDTVIEAVQKGYQAEPSDAHWEWAIGSLTESKREACKTCGHVLL
jgi:hypothetical protein